MSSVVIAIFLLSIGASFVQRTTGFGFGIFIMTMLPYFMPTYGEATTVLTNYCFGLGGIIIGTTLGAYVFRRIPNRAFRYVVYAYIGVSGVIILLTNG